MNSRDKNINKKTICILNSFKSHQGILALMVAKIFYVLFVPIFQTLGLWRRLYDTFWTDCCSLILTSCYWCPERGFKWFLAIRLIVRSGSIMEGLGPDIMTWWYVLLSIPLMRGCQHRIKVFASFLNFLQDGYASYGTLVIKKGKLKHYVQTAGVKH